jgi:hypothetical protein
MEHEDDVGLDTIARCRELLGPEANALSDAEIDKIGRHAETVAHVVISLFVAERSSLR